MNNIEFETYRDDAGRSYHYAVRTYPGATGLGIHFSAFFERIHVPGLVAPEFSGYFHRLRMLGDNPSHNWLFLCDNYGSAKNGCFYAGEKGDFFVRAATEEILRRVWKRLGIGPEDSVMVGSSGGAIAALQFGLSNRVRGIVAIGPVIDLDRLAAHSERYDHVAFICPDGDPLSPDNWVYTRQLRSTLEAWPTGSQLPTLFVQSCLDDPYRDQVIPFTESWQRKGGALYLDIRASGGHTSEYATSAVLHDVIDKLIAGTTIDVSQYQNDPTFVPQRGPVSARLLQRAKGVRALSPALRVARRLRRVAAEGWR